MDYLTRFYPSCQALVQKERKVFSCRRHFWVRSFYQIYWLTWLKLWVLSQAETIITVVLTFYSFTKVFPWNWPLVFHSRTSFWMEKVYEIVVNKTEIIVLAWLRTQEDSESESSGESSGESVSFIERTDLHSLHCLCGARQSHQLWLLP